MRRLVGAVLTVGFSLGAFAHGASAYPGNCTLSSSYWSYCGSGDADDAHRPRRTCQLNSGGQVFTYYTYGNWTRVAHASNSAAGCTGGYLTAGGIVQKTEHY